MKKCVSFALSLILIVTTSILGSVSAFAAVTKPKLTSAKANSSSAVTIKWNKVNKVSGYVIYRKTGKKSFSKIATVASNKTSYKNTKLSPSTKYTYGIKAYKKSGSKMVYSKMSNTKSVTTKAGYKLNKTKITFTKYGEEKTVAIKGLNKNKYYDNITWESSDTDIAYVTGYGSSVATITVYKSGTCTITAKYNGTKYTCKVVVKMPASKCKLSLPSLPETYDYYYTYTDRDELQTSMKINAIDYEFSDNWDSGNVGLSLTITGTKTYDLEGASGTNPCEAIVKLKDSSSIIVDSSYIYASGYKTGESFKLTDEIYFSNLPADNYTVVIEDYYL